MSGKTSMLDAVKIQARAVIPIVKALEREIGKPRAHALVGAAIANDYAKWQAQRIPVRNLHPRRNGDNPFPVERQIVDDTESSFAVNMTSCQFADYFRSIGEPEIGALLTCGVDFANEAVQRPDWLFERTQTLMQGAPFCDFRWRRKSRDTSR
jgi:L-2-amino-thiazoline-4-carboxylic acid hydrolase